MINMPKIQLKNPDDALTLMFKLRKDGHKVTRYYHVVEWEYKRGKELPKELIPEDTKYEEL